MKAKIEKRVYNTKTSKQISGIIRVQINCNIVNVRIYKKRNGEYFLNCSSNPSSYYRWYNFLADSEQGSNSPQYHLMFNGEFNVPLPTEEDVEYWLDMIN